MIDATNDRTYQQVVRVVCARRDQKDNGFSVHSTGYFKNEKKEKESKRGRISQQFTSTQLAPPGCHSLRKKISRAL